jgi:hypothetical protein
MNTKRDQIMKRTIIAALCGLLAIAPALAMAKTSVLVHTSKPYNRVIRAIYDMGGRVTHQYRHVGGLAVTIPDDKLAELQAIRGVSYVEKDVIMEMPKPGGEMNGVFEFEGGEAMGAGEMAAYGVSLDNYYSYLSSVTGAEDTWGATNAGANSLVAVIDSGTQEHVCLDGRVIAGPDFSTDVGGPDEGSTNPGNYYHGTFVGGMVASNCGFVIVDGDPFDLFLPPEAKIDDFPAPGLSLVPLLGTAPLANIYAVKVFPASGAGASTSRINAAIDHVIDQKRSGALDIDVLNMSLGGASLAPGKSMQEKLVDSATAADIVRPGTEHGR